jgi:hypothetical protein
MSSGSLSKAFLLNNQQSVPAPVTNMMRYGTEQLKDQHYFSDYCPDAFPVYPPDADTTTCTSDIRIGGYNLAEIEFDRFRIK